MNRIRWVMGGTMALMCLGLVPRCPAADEKRPAEDQSTFKMEEISILDQTKDATLGMQRSGGVTATVTTTPAKEVKAYPKLNSPRPLYGAVYLIPDPEKPGQRQKYCFVLDQSPEAVKAAAKLEEKTSGDDSEEDSSSKKAKKRPAPRMPTGAYDLLYFDANCDLDLTNDAVVHVMKERPKVATPWLGNEENMSMFDLVAVSLGEGRSVRVLPMLLNYGTTRVVHFMAASARQGEIRLGKKAYKATLSPANGTFGRMDLPASPLILTPVEGSKKPQPYSWMSTLGTIREVDGEFYAVSASPSGDRVFVRVYPGERGVLEVSAGKRDIKEIGLVGILQCKGSYMPLGEMSFPPPADRVRVAKYQLPVGDYQPLLLNVDYGRYQVSLRANYSAMAGSGKTPGSIEIRPDKPCILDFSEKAEMQFTAPAKETVFKPGDTIRLAAMLAIPGKNLQLSGLTDTSKKIGEVKYMLDGKLQNVPRYAALEPEVVITNSAGKKMCGGTMPFG